MARTKVLRWCRVDPDKYLGDGMILAPKYKRDAGYDLIVSEMTTLKPLWTGAGVVDALGYTMGSFATSPTNIPCGIRIALPDNVCAMVVGRSSAVVEGIIVVATLIDPGYRGDMYIFAYNMTPKNITLLEGNRIAQLLPLNAVGQTLRLQEVPASELPPSERGDAGFGSTGGDNYG